MGLGRPTSTQARPAYLTVASAPSALSGQRRAWEAEASEEELLTTEAARSARVAERAEGGRQHSAHLPAAAAQSRRHSASQLRPLWDGGGDWDNADPGQTACCSAALCGLRCVTSEGRARGQRFPATAHGPRRSRLWRASSTSVPRDASRSLGPCAPQRRLACRQTVPSKAYAAIAVSAPENGWNSERRGVRTYARDRSFFKPHFGRYWRFKNVPSSLR